MFDVGESLRPGLDRARSALHAAQSAIAEANSGGGGRSAGAALAATAEAATFAEALLAAEHARLEEIKMVTR